MPYLLHHLAVLLHEAAVHTIHHGRLVRGVLQVVVEGLGLGLSHTVVVVACRGQHEVLTIGLVYTLGHHCRVKDGGEHLIAESLYGLSLSQGQLGGIHREQGLLEEFG